jgi:hypothetical protein
MVSRTGSTEKINDIKYFGFGVYTVTFSQNDTYTASDFVDTENLKSATIVQNVDGTVLTNSIANNVVTCTSAVTDKECTVFLFGVRSS